MYYDIMYLWYISFSPDTTAYAISKKIHDNNDKACLLMVCYVYVYVAIISTAVCNCGYQYES